MSCYGNIPGNFGAHCCWFCRFCICVCLKRLHLVSAVCRRSFGSVRTKTCKVLFLNCWLKDLWDGVLSAFETYFLGSVWPSFGHFPGPSSCWSSCFFGDSFRHREIPLLDPGTILPIWRSTLLLFGHVVWRITKAAGLEIQLSVPYLRCHCWGDSQNKCILWSVSEGVLVSPASRSPSSF